MTPRLTVLYGRDADAYSIARAADRALEGSGVYVSVEKTETGDTAVWLVEHGDPRLLGYWFLPGCSRRAGACAPCCGRGRAVQPDAR